jgi:hypothetical protein
MAAATDDGIAVSLVVMRLAVPASLFAGDKSYPSIHVAGTGNCLVRWTTLNV